jgi:hypothetical protein
MPACLLLPHSPTQTVASLAELAGSREGGPGSFAVVFVLLAEGVVDAEVGGSGLAVDAVGVGLEQGCLLGGGEGLGRACCQTSPYPMSFSGPPRAVRNRRPSGPVP